MNPPIATRPATPDDAEWCAQLMATSQPWVTLGRSLDQCRRACTIYDAELFVAHCEEDRRGFLLLVRRGVAGSPYIASLAVSPRHGGTGIGSGMIAFAESLCRGNARFVFICVSSFNPRARALYERLGFESLCDLQDHIIDGAAETLMRKRLSREDTAVTER